MRKSAARPLPNPPPLARERGQIARCVVANGDRVLRLTNDEIYRNLDGIRETILSATHPRFSTHT
jgi:hypothetical protein